ncbi:MAG: hypothetical protein Q8R08_01690 [bacterium]|nr:hypothetical protein [bacterium]
MERTRFVQVSLGWLAVQVLRAKERPYAIFQETTTTTGYKLQIQIEGLGNTVTKAVVSIFPLPGKVTQTLPVLTVLKDKTELVEDTGIVIESGQPRFIIVTVKLGPRKKMRISGGWWFLVDGSLPLGFDVNIERKLIPPTSSLTVTLAPNTTGTAL